jgi:hypothetical protein
MPTITDLRRWRNGEVFNARDYIYERDLIVSEINRLAGLLSGESNLNVNNLSVAGSLTVNGQNLDDIVRGQAVYTSLEEPTDQESGDLWFDNN